MRSLSLIIAGSLVAACGGPQADNSSAVASENREEAGVAPSNEVAANDQTVAPAAPAANSVEVAQAGAASPCLVQGTERLEVTPIRAVGTEPFWGARVEGRCVTYSTPENQQGVRIWTRYTAGQNGRGAWVGQLDGQKFEMRVRPEAGCSDGMSDESYPMAVELSVNGESRKGCAKPL